MNIIVSPIPSIMTTDFLRKYFSQLGHIHKVIICPSRMRRDDYAIIMFERIYKDPYPLNVYNKLVENEEIIMRYGGLSSSFFKVGISNKYNYVRKEYLDENDKGELKYSSEFNSRARYLVR